MAWKQGLWFNNGIGFVTFVGRYERFWLSSGINASTVLGEEGQIPCKCPIDPEGWSPKVFDTVLFLKLSFLCIIWPYKREQKLIVEFYHTSRYTPYNIFGYESKGRSWPGGLDPPSHKGDLREFRKSSENFLRWGYPRLPTDMVSRWSRSWNACCRCIVDCM